MSPDRIEVSSVVISPTIEIPRDGRGRMFLAVLKDRPKELASTVEAEARRLRSEGIEITSNNLIKHRLSGFVASVQNYYPGGMLALRESMGNPLKKRPHGYWQDPANIEREARQLAEQGNNLTKNKLKKIGMATLCQAAQEYYPGGFGQLKIDLGLQLSRKDKYWTSETVEDEAREFVKQNGGITHRSLAKAGRHDFGGAIRNHYPGQFSGLNKTLGIESNRKPNGYWTPERIEQEAREVYQILGTFTQDGLRKNNKSDLSSAIKKHYPGGMAELKEKLGISLRDEKVISADQANEELSKLLEG